MGQSTDAYLFWGFCNEEDEHFPQEMVGEGDEAERDWEAAYAAKMGLDEPAESCTGGSPAWSRYWDAKRRLIEACPAKIDTHCSCDYPIGLVCIGASFRCASRGTPVEITSLEVGPTWRSDLEAFCELMGVPWQEPKWWLASHWC